MKAGTAATFGAQCGGRPPVQVWGTRGMASSMHPLASQAAIDVLRDGGNAIDAAVAMGAVISVTSPDWAGPAGDSAWLVYLAEANEFHHLDGYATCSEATTAASLRERFALDPARDPRSFDEEPPDRRDVGVVTGMVPGTPAAWVELSRRFGRLSLGQLLEPAIGIAARGFAINRYLSLALASHRDKIGRYPSSRALVCDAEGAPIGEGARLCQPELAATLRRIADHGFAGFYGGETATRIVDYCASRGGTISHDDLLRYRAVWRAPIAGSYRGTGIVVSPPPTAGVHVVQALNLLEGFDLARLDYHGAASLHLLIESLKLALADRRASGGDPDHLRIDTARLADKAYADALRSRIDAGRAQSLAATSHPGAGTTHFCVIDEAGNMVSATQTIGSRFGCGEAIEGTGLFMNDRTWWMSLREGHPNAVAPFRRANIGHAPTMLLRDGRPYATLGSPGGFGIVQYVVQVVVNMLDYGLDLQSAIEAPRFKIEDLAGTLLVEERLEAATRAALAALGHRVKDVAGWTDRVGGVEGVCVDAATRSMLGGYDPRRNSMAAGLD